MKVLDFRRFSAYFGPPTRPAAAGERFIRAGRYHLLRLTKSGPMALPETENDRDIELLLSNPQKLLVKYQETIRIIVKKYVLAGMFLPAEVRDVVQSVNAALFARIPAIQRRYNGSTLFVTYFSSIVRNECLRIRNRAMKRVETDRLPDEIPDQSRWQPDHGRIREAMHRLETILTLFDARRHRVMFLLKLRYRFPITEQDVRAWYPGCPVREVAQLLRNFGTYYEEMQDYRIHALITPVMNRADRKTLRQDSTRKEMKGLVVEIIGLLNGDPSGGTFDEETLGILLEKFLFPFSAES